MKGLYRIPEGVKKDIEDFKIGVEKFLKGDIHPTRFRAHRVPLGVYEQRENNTYMARTRIPAGGITPHQLETISKLSKKHGNGLIHLTSRQDLQIHSIKLNDAPVIMESLLEAGITTKGGGGNTVRNITACRDSGICEKELFDVAPYAIALTEHMIKDPRSYTLPRKFKVAFSGCGSDCSLATVNDVGFIAVEKEINGDTKRGFRVYVAGGMGSGSRIATLLEDFIPVDEIANVCDAVKSLFDKNGNRRNKHKARLRFLITTLGQDEFFRLYKQELEAIKKGGGTKLEIGEATSAPSKSDYPVSEADKDVAQDGDYQNWLNLNVTKQKQSDFNMVTIRLPLGDIASERLISFAATAKKYGEGVLRSDINQNLLLRWIHNTELGVLYKELKDLDLHESCGTARDIICCAGSSTCRLGICLSRGLTGGITKKLAEESEKFDRLKNIQIKVSGCPNSCGHHPIGGIGLFGASRRVGERLAPYYIILLGGRVEEGKSCFGESMGLVHARYIPEVISRFLDDFSKQQDVDYYEYVEKSGKNFIKTILGEYAEIPSYEEDKTYYQDWGSEELFSLAGRGPGECGAGVFDMIEVDLKEAEAAVETGKNAINQSAESAAPYLYNAINRASRALLVTRGVEADSDLKAFELFEQEFIDTSLVEVGFIKLMFMAAEYKKGNLRDEALIQGHEKIGALVTAIKELYGSMDDSLQFNKTEDLETSPQKDKEPEKIEPEKNHSGRKVMDLKGVKCPFNYVKAKIEIEMMEIGEEIELQLDDGEPIRNVPNSLKNDGQEILKMEQQEAGHFVLLVKKKA